MSYKDTLETPVAITDPVRRAKIDKLASARVDRSPSASRLDIERIAEPDEPLKDGVRFDQSYQEVLSVSRDEESLARLTRYALVWSGIRVSNDAINWAVIDQGYRTGERLPRVTLPIDDKRLSLRVVPDSWSNKYDTPFLFKIPDGYGEKRPAIVTYTKEGEEVVLHRPTSRYTTDSVMSVAYKVTHIDGMTSITVNPKQRCPQNCEFCCRGYHDMTAERKRSLINLSPIEMSEVIAKKFPEISDWSSVGGITLVTGDFRNCDELVEYLGLFTNEMRSITNGDWDPLVNDWQDIGISTHLIKTEADMKRLKSIGMKRFIHTIEMADDDYREDVMHLGSVRGSASEANKGHSNFNESLDSLQRAIGVFGVGGVEAVLVIGLDDADVTSFSLDKIKKSGVQRVSSAMVNVYDRNQFSLIRQSFPDVVASMGLVKHTFDSPYRRRSSGDLLDR